MVASEYIVSHAFCGNPTSTATQKSGKGSRSLALVILTTEKVCYESS